MVATHPTFKLVASSTALSTAASTVLKLLAPNKDDAAVASDDEVVVVGDTSHEQYETTTCGISFINAFSNWTELNALVHKIALQSNKQISMVGDVSGSKKKVYRCQEWIACRKKWQQRVRNILLHCLKC